VKVTCLPLLLTVGFGNQPKKEASQVKKTARFVIWICSKFTREEIEEIIKGLSDVLANRNPDVKPKDDFQEKHPHYHNFFVDPNSLLKAPLTLRFYS